MSTVDVLFRGSGISGSIPGIGSVGLSTNQIYLWAGEPFMGFTSANLQGTLGLASIETPVCIIPSVDEGKAERFRQLHRRRLKLRIDPHDFGDSATVGITLFNSVDGELVEEKMLFIAEHCKGFSLTVGAIDLDVEMLQIEQSQWTPPMYFG